MDKEEKLLKKGRLRFAYDELGDDVKTSVREEYHLLLMENQKLDRYMRQHMYYSILPAAAFYRVLPQKGYTKRDAFQMIRKSVLETAKPAKRFLEKCGKLPFFFPVFRRICKLSMSGSYCGDEWKFIWKKQMPDRIEWECHSCIYFNRFNQYGMRELTMIFCESDDVMYGNIQSARWGRTQTIGRGAKFCDFRFYKERRS